jgi:hypothetical protein
VTSRLNTGKLLKFFKVSYFKYTYFNPYLSVHWHQPHLLQCGACCEVQSVLVVHCWPCTTSCIGPSTTTSSTTRRPITAPAPVHTLLKKVSRFPVPRRDDTYQTLPRGEYLIFSVPGKIAKLFLQCRRQLEM